MNYNKYKKVALVMFVLLTLIVTGGAIFIGIRLSQTPSTAPEDTNADVPVECFNEAVGVQNLCACQLADQGNFCCSGPMTSGDSCSGEKYTNECTFDTVGNTDKDISIMSVFKNFTQSNVNKMAACTYRPDTTKGIEWVDGKDFKCDCSAYVPAGGYTDFNITNCTGNQRQVSFLGRCEVNNYPYSCSICVQLEGTTTPGIPSATPTRDVPTSTPLPTRTEPSIITTVRPSIIGITGTVVPEVTWTSLPTRTPTRTIAPTATSRAVITTVAPSTTIIPATALISNEVDVIIMGFTFVFFGVALYKSGLYIKIGQVYWEGAGEKLSSGLSSTNSGFLSFLDNIWAGLSHLDKTITYMFYQTKVRIRMGSVLIYNNLILIKEQILTFVLKIISKILNFLLFVTIKFKKLVRTIKVFFKALVKSIGLSGKESIKTINKKIKKLPKNFEEKVIDDREEVSE